MRNFTRNIFFFFLLSAAANAGINGTYKVKGSETEEGNTYSAVGSLKVSKFRYATYDYNAGDGTSDFFKVKFRKPIKDIASRQKVRAYNKDAVATAIFTKKGAKNYVKFTYRSKDGTVVGSTSGFK